MREVVSGYSLLSHNNSTYLPTHGCNTCGFVRSAHCDSTHDTSIHLEEQALNMACCRRCLASPSLAQQQQPRKRRSRCLTVQAAEIKPAYNKYRYIRLTCSRMKVLYHSVLYLTARQCRTCVSLASMQPPVLDHHPDLTACWALPYKQDCLMTLLDTAIRSRYDIDQDYINQWKEVTARDRIPTKMTPLSFLWFVPLYMKYHVIPGPVRYLWWVTWSAFLRARYQIRKRLVLLGKYLASISQRLLHTWQRLSSM